MAGWLAFRELANAIHIELSCEKIVTFFLELRASHVATLQISPRVA